MLSFAFPTAGVSKAQHFNEGSCKMHINTGTTTSAKTTFTAILVHV